MTSSILGKVKILAAWATDGALARDPLSGLRPDPEPKAIGFRIDVEARSIEPWGYDGDYRTMYPAIGCDTFTTAEFDADTQDSVFIDDEGLLKPVSYLFGINGYPQPLAGNGIVLGCDEDGESVTPTCTLDDLIANVWFYAVIGRNQQGAVLAHRWRASAPDLDPEIVILAKEASALEAPFTKVAPAA